LAGLEKARKVSAKVVSEKANEAYSDLVPVLKALRFQGLSLRQIAQRLNEDGHTTRRNRPWNPQQVSLVLKRHNRLQ
jgi:hypothetical protein